MLPTEMKDTEMKDLITRLMNYNYFKGCNKAYRKYIFKIWFDAAK